MATEKYTELEILGKSFSYSCKNLIIAVYLQAANIPYLLLSAR